ncbi:hypothetical protein SLA2020_245700 [Shorea laevis]
MLYKILNVHKLVSLRHRAQPKPEAPPPPQLEEEIEEDEPSSAALRIVHVGGTVECYYVAIPAACIMKKYPNFRLARPDVFRLPGESLMRFIGIDGKNKAVGKTEQGIPKKSPDSKAGEGKRRPRNATSWQPDLTSITELHGSDK